MFKEIKRRRKNPIKKQLKCVALRGVAGHQMAAALPPVHRGACTYLLCVFFFFFWLALLSPPLLPFSYAVMKADVGRFCFVLLSLPPDNIPTSRREEKLKEKKSYAVHGLQKKVKRNTFKKK
ncbi:hypothetical protein FQA47_018954 [Oryzias melastigma]|uniref:Transmembrane protein n=1 Tax=Oryzias melastigma TaxID=30732 RepID=A0A834F6L7_ORYME|nr:hypothetical protein FQA47_018954 [Oryzias melastigma]